MLQKRPVNVNFMSCIIRSSFTMDAYYYYYYYSITSTDANKLERIQQKLTALCFKRCFPQIDHCYEFALKQLKLHTL
jgi:hypothetical protein